MRKKKKILDRHFQYYCHVRSQDIIFGSHVRARARARAHARTRTPSPPELLPAPVLGRLGPLEHQRRLLQHLLDPRRRLGGVQGRGEQVVVVVLLLLLLLLLLLVAGSGGRADALCYRERERGGGKIEQEKGKVRRVQEQEKKTPSERVAKVGTLFFFNGLGG